jgi:hypothetical protein
MRTSGPNFMVCTLELVFDVIEGVRSCFHVLRAPILFRRYRGRRLTFSSFAIPDSFSLVTRASGPVFKFCAPVLIFGGTEGIVSRFQVLRAQTHFQRYRGRRVPFSCLARPDSFSAVPRTLVPVFLFCAPGLVFGGSASGPVFKFCAPELIFGGTGASGPVFKFCAPLLIFGLTEGVVSRFHVLRFRTHLRRVLFSCFARPDLFTAVPRASGPIFKFCAP